MIETGSLVLLIIVSVVLVVGLGIAVVFFARPNLTPSVDASMAPVALRPDTARPVTYAGHI